MILVVILHRYRTELETANLGQRDDIHYQATYDELDAPSLSERTHLALQALSRGASRVTLSDSQATPSNCFMIEREEELETQLNKVMPGCQFKTWEPTYADVVAHGNLGCSGSSVNPSEGALHAGLGPRRYTSCGLARGVTRCPIHAAVKRP